MKHKTRIWTRYHLCCYQGLETQGRGQGRGLENWSSRIVEDKDFPRGQQHNSAVRQYGEIDMNLNLTGAQWQINSSLSHRKTIVLDISHATLAYSILENFRGLELPRTRTKTRILLEDNNTDYHIRKALGEELDSVQSVKKQLECRRAADNVTYRVANCLTSFCELVV